MTVCRPSRHPAVVLIVAPDGAEIAVKRNRVPDYADEEDHRGDPADGGCSVGGMANSREQLNRLFCRYSRLMPDADATRKQNSISWSPRSPTSPDTS